MNNSSFMSSSQTCAVSTLTKGNAFDLILVSSRNSHMTSCSEPTFNFGSFGAVSCGSRVVLEVEAVHLDQYITNIVNRKPQESRHYVQFPIDENLKIRLPENHISNVTMREREISPLDQPKHDPKALGLLAALLESGCNRGRYLLLSEADTITAIATVNVHLWSVDDRIAVVDIDGTITKSNVRGVVDTVLTQTYLYCHDGVCELLSTIPNVRVVYLTCRPISLSDKTRDFLSRLRQADHTLPHGALIGFTGSLTQMIFMELIYKSANDFKREALRRHVVEPYKEVGVDVSFTAAFGNTLTDMAAYHATGMDLDSIYLIDKQSSIFCLDGKTCEADALADRHEFYLLARGTKFQGYRDRRLLTHISEKLQVASTSSSACSMQR